MPECAQHDEENTRRVEFCQRGELSKEVTLRSPRLVGGASADYSESGGGDARYTLFVVR